MPAASRFFAMPPEKITTWDEIRFFGQLKTGNGTFKRTEPGRLDLLNGWLIEQLREIGAVPRELLDIGISSGVTTLELSRAMKQAGFPVRVTGTDRAFSARLVELSPQIRVLAEPDGHILQYELFGMPLRAWYRRLDFVDGMALLRFLAHALLHKRVSAALRAGNGRSVRLVTPRLRLGAEFKLVEDDITVPNPDLTRKFDLIRAANILNRHYFTPELLLRAVGNVRSYMRGPGSLLLVVRTCGASAQHGTLFRMEQDGCMRILARCGSGSEVEDVVLKGEGITQSG